MSAIPCYRGQLVVAGEIVRVARRRLGGVALLLGTLLLAGCAQDPRCETLVQAAERQAELVLTLSEYVASGPDPQADTVEAMLRDLDLALSVLNDAEIRARMDASCPARVRCDAYFREGVEATLEMWRVWAQERTDAIWNTAHEIRGLTDRASGDCVCLPWNEAEAAWRGVRDLSESENVSRLALALDRTREATETCWK